MIPFASNTTAWASCACPPRRSGARRRSARVQNFPISGQPIPRGFIRALGLVKAAAAEVNVGLALLPKGVAKAIRSAALQVAAGEYDAHFPIDIYQTGSGTSSNMNANEVIANAGFGVRQGQGACQRRSATGTWPASAAG